ENLGHGEPVRLDVDLVVGEQERAVDVEEDEPGHGVSSAARSERTYARSGSAPSSATATAREPTTTPSVSSAAARACSGVEMPKPAYSGASVSRRARPARPA